MGPKRPVTLRGAIDQDVYHIIKKLEDANDGRPFKGITPAYEAIKRSNSSLSRQKKRPLEDAIDRVLQFRKQELDESDSESDLEKAEPVKPDDERFLLNRQMTKHWQLEPAPQAPDSGEGPVGKKRRLQVEGEEREGRNGLPASAPALIPAPSNGRVETDAIPAEKLKKTHPKKAPKSSRFEVEYPSDTQKLGGIGEVYHKLRNQVLYLLKRPDHYAREGWRQISGVIVSGPAGVGKKSLVRLLASKLEVPIVSLTQCFVDPERMEKSLNDAIEEAMRLAPCIIFIEQLDQYMPSPGANNHSDHQQRAFSQFKNQMIRIQKEQPKDRPIVAIATTSRIADVNPDARKLSMFERTVEMKAPDLDARQEIFEVVTEGSRLADDIDFAELARRTHGYVGADIIMLMTQAQHLTMIRMMQDEDNRSQSLNIEGQITALEAKEISSETLHSTLHDLPPGPVRQADFLAAMDKFTPSLRQNGFSSIPDVTWSQVGALKHVRNQLKMSIVGPIKNPKLYQSVGLNTPAGCLIWGPPGCGKTLVAQAIANEAQASFIMISGPELLNKYVGESERAVRELFNRARLSAPCILFFDEIDSIAPKRDGTSTESGNRVVNSLLTQLDGPQGRAGVYVIGTTNRPDMIDHAMLRPGRLSVKLFVDIPTAEERFDILKAIYRTKHHDASPEELANLRPTALDPRCDGFSGADLDGLHTRAGESAISRWLKGDKGEEATPKINNVDWEDALASTRRSVQNPEAYRKLERAMRE